jgi:hypothetical protein
MRRFLMDTGIAGDFIDRRRGVFERARPRLGGPDGRRPGGYRTPSAGSTRPIRL